VKENDRETDREKARREQRDEERATERWSKRTSPPLPVVFFLPLAWLRPHGPETAQLQSIHAAVSFEEVAPFVCCRASSKPRYTDGCCPRCSHFPFAS